MSDTSQGPDWWQASDGKWYPPSSAAGAPPPPQYGAPPPAKKGRGCLIGSLAGIGGLVVLGVIALIVVIAIVVASSGDDDKTSNTVRPGQGTEENPAAEDVTITECTPGEEPLNFPEAKGEITNHSSKPSNYTFSVSFEVDGNRVAEGAVFQNAVAPDQTSQWSTTGSQQTTASSIECKVLEVTRFAS